MTGGVAGFPRVPPSGRQLTITQGTQTVTVVGVGGGLRAYDVDGSAVLDGYAADEMCSGGRGQLLIPWPNRIADGHYRFGGRDLQLALSTPAEHNAGHGLTRWAGWDLDSPAPGRAVARHVLHAQPGYPFTLGCEAGYAVGPTGLTVRMSVVNLSDAAAPVGMGAHPYVTAGTALVDDAFLRVPAATRLISDGRGIPVSSAPVAGSEFDFTAQRPIGDLVLDTGYTDLERDDDGRARVRLATADGARSVTVWMDETWGYLQIFTGDTLSPDRRRRGLAVEPMTCAPDAFRSGAGLRVLEPGETIAGTWGISPSS